MSSSQNPEVEFLHIDIDIEYDDIERNLENRRRVKLLMITMIFLISIGVVIYSVVHDIKTNNGRLIHLESVLCSEGDEDCLSLVCPQHMRFNREKDGCENKEEVLELAQMGVVGNNKLMCREGFVWVEWKSQCLRKT